MNTPIDESTIRLCQGDCGRMTRSRDTRDRVVDDQATGTVARVDSKYCGPCYRKFAPSAQLARDRDTVRRNNEKEQRLQAALRARDELAAARQRRLGDLPRRSRVMVAR